MKTTRFMAAAAAMILSISTLTPLKANAESASGSIGEDLSWQISGSGNQLTLTISGTGEADYYQPGEWPWASYSERITSLVIKPGITMIEWMMFQELEGITSVEIPSTVTEIGKRAFADCANLRKVTLHEGLETINDSAFYNTELTAINFPSTVDYFGFGAFTYTPWMSAQLSKNDFVIVNHCLLRVSMNHSGTIVVPDDVLIISPGAFTPYNTEYTQTGGHTGHALGNVETITTIVVPEGVKRIDEFAFWFTKQLEKAELPASLEEIGWNAFCGSTCTDIWYHGTEEQWKEFNSAVSFNLDKNAGYTVHTEASLSSNPVPMYRLYNPNSGEHFYTAKAAEKDALAKIGWKYEGIGWTAPEASVLPVYRLYNRNAGDHHYTMKKAERDVLVKAGWDDEGIGWFSDENEEVPLYRQYNPYARSGSHNYTTNKKENDALVKIGWIAEGTGWYGMKAK